MKLDKEYLSLTDYENLKQIDKDNEKRVVISDDAFAICQFLKIIAERLN